MSIPLKSIEGMSRAISPPRPKTLALVSGGDLIIAPHTRHPAVIHAGGSTIFGRIFDRDRDRVIIEMEDAMMVRLLARLVTRCLGEGVLLAPSGVQRVGIRFQEKPNIYGCFGLDREGHELLPLVTVDIERNRGMALINEPRTVLRTRGETAAHAMLGATAVFMGHAST